MSVDSCKTCEHSGLPFLFLSHVAVALKPHSDPVDATPWDPLYFAPHGLEKLETDLVSVSAMGLPSLTAGRYVLRTLRPETYLYLYHETPPRHLVERMAKIKATSKEVFEDDAHHWEVFRVMPGGALVYEDDARFQVPVPFSCTNEGHILTTATYRLRDAHLASGLWVAVSGNRWDKTLKNANKKNPQVMRKINVPEVLAGGSNSVLRRPQPEWLEKCVADFALETLDHRAEMAWPLAKLKGRGSAFGQRMRDLSAGHEKTLDKGCAVILQDPAGVARSLSELSLARNLHLAAHMNGNEHAISTSTAMGMIRDSMRSGLMQEVDLKAAGNASFPRLLSDAERCDPMLTAQGKAQADAVKDNSEWVVLGRVSAPVQRPHWPPSTRWWPLEDQSPLNSRQLGWAVVALEEWVEHRTASLMKKIDRLHDAKAIQRFNARIKQLTDHIQGLVQAHDDDRATILQWRELGLYFKQHFNPEERNKPEVICFHSAGEAYLKEAAYALMGMSYSEKLAEVVVAMVRSAPSSLDSWGLRAMVANQNDLLNEQATFLSNQYNWYFTEGGKVDKTYDALKALMSDDYFGGARSAKYNWLIPGAIGLSFGVQGFLCGALLYLVGKEAGERGLAAAKAAQQGMSKLQVRAATRARQAGAVMEEAGKVSQRVVNTAMTELSTKLHSFCHVLSNVMVGVIDKTIPRRPVVAQAILSTSQWIAVVGAPHLSPQGMAELRSRWAQMPAHLRNQEVEFRFVTTRENLAQYHLDGGRQETRFEVVAVKELSDGGIQVKMGIQELTVVYAHSQALERFKQGVGKAIGEGGPAAVTRLFRMGAAGLTGASRVAGRGGTALMEAMRVVGQSAAAAGQATVRGGTAVYSLRHSEGLMSPGWFGFFGAWLQDRMLETNEKKLAQLKERLDKYTYSLDAQQKQAIEDTMLLLQWSIRDNQCGRAGGLLELSGFLVKDLSKVVKNVPGRPESWKAVGLRVSAGSLLAGATLAGAGGSVANAVTNYYKAAAKYADGDHAMKWGYGIAAGLHGASALAGGIAGFEMLLHLVRTKNILEVTLLSESAMVRLGLRSAATRVGTAVATRAGFGFGMMLFGLSFSGWALLMMVGATIVEGLVVYYDRTKLEAWIESSYFGAEPQWRDSGPTQGDAWGRELKALEDALATASADGATGDKFDPAKPDQAPGVLV